jgi:hypothetical protein
MAEETKAVIDRIEKAPEQVLARAASVTSTAESRIKAMITALTIELEKIEGEGSSFLANAKSHAANALLHIESHFTWVRGQAAIAAAKVETDAANLAAKV